MHFYAMTGMLIRDLRADQGRDDRQLSIVIRIQGTPIDSALEDR
jgi:hypothetical protein